MSETIAPQRQNGGFQATDILSLLLILALAAGASWYLIRDRQYSLSQSAMGHSGLIAYLRSEGIEARAARGLYLTPDKAGLRILPLHDTDLLSDFSPPEEQADYLATATEYDIAKTVVLRKINTLPSLIIAPKWSRAARFSGFAHQSLLLDVDIASRPFLQLNVMEKPLIRPNAKLVEFTASIENGPPISATLYAPQLFPPKVPEGCTSILGNALGHLLIECAGHLKDFLALSDPDLLNNHGLALGDNAKLVENLIKTRTNDLPVLIDNTTIIFVEDKIPAGPKRKWSDLLRLFSYPFSIVWAAGGFLMALVFWRSWSRFGPPKRIFNDQIGASKSVSIAARARLLRMSGNDVALFESHISGRIRQLEEHLFGQNVLDGDPIRRIFQLLEHREPELASAFATAAVAAQTPAPGTSAAALLELAEEFDRQTERVMYAFRRT